MIRLLLRRVLTPSQDWDPVVRDNIMVTGYILLCVSLYEKLTGDARYQAKDSLHFRITEKKTYRHNAKSIFEALMQNWESCSYCLFPCEVCLSRFRFHGYH